MKTRTGLIAAAIALSLVIIALRSLAPMQSDGWLFLLIAPIALLAVEFSFAGGLAAALLASACVFVFKLTGVMDYTWTGVSVRTAAFLIAGAGVGYLVEERAEREAQLQEYRHKVGEHEQGLLLNDEVVQGIAVAKMALEMDDPARARATLESTLKRAQELASQGVSDRVSLVRKERSTAD